MAIGWRLRRPPGAASPSLEEHLGAGPVSCPTGQLFTCSMDTALGAVQAAHLASECAAWPGGTPEGHTQRKQFTWVLLDGQLFA